MKPTKYCLGFCFNDDGSSVVLMVKRRPDWQAGLLNGVGGHVEDNESVSDSMSREFYEETGVQTHEREWTLFCEMSGARFHVFCFQMMSTRHHDASKTVGDESVVPILLSDLAKVPHISNLDWLIPLALDKGNHDKPLMTFVTY